MTHLHVLIITLCVCAGIDPSGCLENPCQNGAQCIEEDDSFTCVCQPGFEGPRCEYGKGKQKFKKQRKSKISSLSKPHLMWVQNLLHWRYCLGWGKWTSSPFKLSHWPTWKWPFCHLPGVLGGKVDTGMCGPDRVPFQPLRFTNGTFLFENWFRL